MNKKWRTIFMGTPDFALPGLKRLITAPDFELVGVFSRPDKAIGRQQKISSPPVKLLAKKHQIPVWQPWKISTEYETIQKLQPDIIIVIAYGQIIPQKILDIPPQGIINVHASLLPKYRGAACLSAPILNGDLESGVTIMKMEAGLDTGPILGQAKIKLSGQENCLDLHNTLSELGAEKLMDILPKYCQGEIKPQKQNEQLASYVKMTKKEDGKIDWSKPAEIIERQIRAFTPWPGSYCQLPAGRNLKIIKAKIGPNQPTLKVGEMKNCGQQLLVGSGQGNLLILELQTAGSRILTAEQWLRGQQNDNIVLK